MKFSARVAPGGGVTSGQLLELTQNQLEELTKWPRLRTLPVGDVFRAKVILSLADGLTYQQIEGLDTAKPQLLAGQSGFLKPAPMRPAEYLADCPAGR